MLTLTIGPDLAHAAEVMVKDYMAVKQSESVLITADTKSDPAVVDAVMIAADNAGAKTVVNLIPPLPFQGRLADPYISQPLAAAMLACDVWIDLTFPYLAGSQPWDEAMKHKRARYMLCGDLKADSMVRMLAKADLDAMYKVHGEFIKLMGDAVGKKLRITNEAGSDVTFINDKAPYPKPRRATDPGFYTVPGAMAIFPIHDSVKGRIVVDSAFHEYYTAMPSPMTLELDGRIQKVIGGGNERSVMDRSLRRAANGDYGYVIHFTCGIQPAARYTGRCFVEDMRVIGNNAVGLGIPFWQPGGGENHPDAVLSLQSIWIEDQLIVDRGGIVGPDKLAKYAEGLVPRYA